MARRQKGKSKRKSIRRRRGPGITSRGKHFYLGRYDTKIEAAKARDRKAFELHGEFAYLNFPENCER